MSGVCLSFGLQKSVLTEMNEVCSSIIIFSINNPGGNTCRFADSELSLYRLKNLYEQDKDVLANQYQILLSKAINNYFDGITVDVSAEDIDVSLKTYKLRVLFTYQNSSVLSFNDIKLNEDGKFTIGFLNN